MKGARDKLSVTHKAWPGTQGEVVTLRLAMDSPGCSGEAEGIHSWAKGVLCPYYVVHTCVCVCLSVRAYEYNSELQDTYTNWSVNTVRFKGVAEPGSCKRGTFSGTEAIRKP